jgi:nucleotide-binding universal stress UspA family protein
MTVLVGYVPHKGGRGSLDLGMQLAHALGTSLSVVTVVPRQWSTPSLARVDAEYAEFAQQLGEQAEAKAREYLVDTSVDIPIDYHAVTGRSVTSALLHAAEECRATVLVLGSSTDGAVGRIVVGSTTDKLLHSSPIPLALSPRGYRSTAADGFSRVTCAFSDGEESEKVVEHAVSFARSLGTPARVASFGVRGATMYPPEVGLSAEDSVLDSWREQASHAQSRLRIHEIIDEDTETVIATGAGWGESMASIDWEPNELLVLGSSTLGPIARVFLGSRATKLIRHSPVPVLVVPRGYHEHRGG